jgi:N-acetylmuramoyl-L-alanine amidase
VTRIAHIVALFIACLAGSATLATATPMIAIDPGHGGADGGAVGVLPQGTVTGLPVRMNPSTGETNILEKDVNLDVAQRVDAYLRARGYLTVMTRTKDLAGGDKPFTTVLDDLQSRVDVAEAANATLFVSLHENALSATATGTETYHYYYASENAKILAQIIHTNLITALGLPDRGVQSAGFYVLRKTSMPAVLVEGMFLSNPTEALMLADPATRQKIADAVGAGVVTYFEQGNGSVPPPSPVTVATKPKYQVNVGTYRRLASAKRRAVLLRSLGFRAVIRSQYSPRMHRSAFVVISGKFTLLNNARRLRDQIRTRNLGAVIGPIPRTSRLVWIG